MRPRPEPRVAAFLDSIADKDIRLACIEEQAGEVEELDIADIDIEDSAFESLLVGRKIKVLLQDVGPVRWRQDLIEDRRRLATLHTAASQVTADRDAKLTELRETIERKCRNPINVGNRKVIVFTAFADTAHYLYDALAPWAQDRLGVQAALVTGAGSNRTTLPDLRRDLGSILTAFAPRSKERPDDLASEGEIDLLAATDCISEGQNLQDRDWLVNYNIHWNPVRIIQRFGRIDRIGSPNERIQLVNFWPNMELEEYLRLEQHVSGRMVLLDISATGEENLIEPRLCTLPNLTGAARCACYVAKTRDARVGRHHNRGGHVLSPHRLASPRRRRATRVETVGSGNGRVVGRYDRLPDVRLARLSRSGRVPGAVVVGLLPSEVGTSTSRSETRHEARFNHHTDRGHRGAGTLRAVRPTPRRRERASGSRQRGRALPRPVHGPRPVAARRVGARAGVSRPVRPA